MAPGRSGRRRASPLLKELRLWERRTRRGVLPPVDLVPEWEARVADARAANSLEVAELTVRLGTIQQALVLAPTAPVEADVESDQPLAEPIPTSSTLSGQRGPAELSDAGLTSVLDTDLGRRSDSLASISHGIPAIDAGISASASSLAGFVRALATRSSDFLGFLTRLTHDRSSTGGYQFPDMPLVIETELQLDWVDGEQDPWQWPAAIARAEVAVEALARQGVRVKLVRGRPVPATQYHPAAAQPASAFSLSGPHGPVVFDQLDVVDQAVLVRQRPGLLHVLIPPARYRPTGRSSIERQPGTAPAAGAPALAFAPEGEGWGRSPVMPTVGGVEPLPLSVSPRRRGLATAFPSSALSPLARPSFGVPSPVAGRPGFATASAVRPILGSRPPLATAAPLLPGAAQSATPPPRPRPSLPPMPPPAIMRAIDPTPTGLSQRSPAFGQSDPAVTVAPGRRHALDQAFPIGQRPGFPRVPVSLDVASPPDDRPAARGFPDVVPGTVPRVIESRSGGLGTLYPRPLPPVRGGRGAGRPLARKILLPWATFTDLGGFIGLTNVRPFEGAVREPLAIGRERSTNRPSMRVGRSRPNLPALHPGGQTTSNGAIISAESPLPRLGEGVGGEGTPALTQGLSAYYRPLALPLASIEDNAEIALAARVDQRTASDLVWPFPRPAASLGSTTVGTASAKADRPVSRRETISGAAGVSLVRGIGFPRPTVIASQNAQSILPSGEALAPGRTGVTQRSESVRIALDWITGENPWAQAEALEQVRQAARSLGASGLRIEIVRGRQVMPGRYDASQGRRSAEFSLPGPTGPVPLERLALLDRAMLVAQRPGFLQVLVAPGALRQTGVAAGRLALPQEQRSGYRPETAPVGESQALPQISSGLEGASASGPIGFDFATRSLGIGDRPVASDGPFEPPLPLPLARFADVAANAAEGTSTSGVAGIHRGSHRLRQPGQSLRTPTGVVAAPTDMRRLDLAKALPPSGFPFVAGALVRAASEAGLMAPPARAGTAAPTGRAEPVRIALDWVAGADPWQRPAVIEQAQEAVRALEARGLQVEIVRGHEVAAHHYDASQGQSAAGFSLPGPTGPVVLDRLGVLDQAMLVAQRPGFLHLLVAPGAAGAPVSPAAMVSGSRRLRLPGVIDGGLPFGPALTLARPDLENEAKDEGLVATRPASDGTKRRGVRPARGETAVRQRRSTSSALPLAPAVAPERVRVVLDWVAGQDPWRQRNVPTIPAELSRRLASQGVQLEFVRGHEVPAARYQAGQGRSADALSVSGSRGTVPLGEFRWLDGAMPVIQRPGQLQLIIGQPTAASASPGLASMPLAPVQGVAGSGSFGAETLANETVMSGEGPAGRDRSAGVPARTGALPTPVRAASRFVGLPSVGSVSRGPGGSSVGSAPRLSAGSVARGLVPRTAGQAGDKFPRYGLPARFEWHDGTQADNPPGYRPTAQTMAPLRPATAGPSIEPLAPARFGTAFVGARSSPLGISSVATGAGPAATPVQRAIATASDLPGTDRRALYEAAAPLNVLVLDVARTETGAPSPWLPGPATTEHPSVGSAITRINAVGAPTSAPSTRSGSVGQARSPGNAAMPAFVFARETAPAPLPLRRQDVARVATDRPAISPSPSSQATTTTASDLSPSPHEETKPPDVDHLARQVYAMIKQRLGVERERLGRPRSIRPW